MGFSVGMGSLGVGVAFGVVLGGGDFRWGRGHRWGWFCYWDWRRGRGRGWLCRSSLKPHLIFRGQPLTPRQQQHQQRNPKKSPDIHILSRTAVVKMVVVGLVLLVGPSRCGRDGLASFALVIPQP